MAIVDMYDIVHDMTLAGQNILNVYQALRANAGETAATISDGFQNSVLPAILAFQNDEVVNNELRIFNLGIPTDFGTFSLGAATGFRLGDASPSFVCGELRFPRTRRDVRNGFKRYRGIEEADYANGVLDGAAIALLEAIGDALIGNWLSSVDAHHIANYVVMKRVCKEVDPVTGKCLQYRLPESDGELVFYQPNSRVCVSTARSQVSSKVPT